MGIITVSVDDAVEKEFRKIVEEKGGRKGDLGKAITDAMKKWTDEKRQKEIAERMLKRMSKGLYRLPKNWKFNREEIYDRG